VHHSTSVSVERDLVNQDGTTSTVNKGMDYIPLHREASYAPACPDILMLYCVRPSDAGGETNLCDGVGLLQSLPAEIREFVTNAELKWHWRASPERWTTTLGVSSKEAALAQLEKLKTRLQPWEKLETHFDGDFLQGVFHTRCVIPTRWGGHSSFCNSLLIYHYREATEYYPKHMYTPTLGDGSQFPGDMLEEIINYAGLRHTACVGKKATFCYSIIRASCMAEQVLQTHGGEFSFEWDMCDQVRSNDPLDYDPTAMNQGSV
jgi:hypothetical protein